MITVKEFIEQLKHLPQDAVVVIYDYDAQYDYSNYNDPDPSLFYPNIKGFKQHHAGIVKQVKAPKDSVVVVL